jgi:hypothetical protein
MMNRVSRLSAIGLFALPALGACGGPSMAPEEELRAWVAAGVDAAESKERQTLVDMMSSAYTDARGNERDDIENLLRLYFLRQNNIKLLPSIENITVFDETAANIELAVAMAGTNDGVFGFSADAYRFALELEKDRGEWRLIAARWGELGEELR